MFTPETAKAFELKPTVSSKAGLNYAAANGTEIKNHGQRIIRGLTGDWVPVESAAQIAEVKRNLASAMRIVKAGNKIVLDDEGSYIENKATGRKIAVETENGDFEFEIWVPKAKSVIEKEKIERANEQNNKVKKEKVDKMEIDSEDENDSMLQMVFMGQV